MQLRTTSLGAVSSEITSSPKYCTYSNPYPRDPLPCPSPVPVLRLVTGCHGSSAIGWACSAAPFLWLLLGIKQY